MDDQVTRLTARVAGTSDGASWGDGAREVMTPEAIAQLAEQAVGQVVTLNYDPGAPIGRVVDAKVDDVGVLLEIELEGDAVHVGPGFQVLQREDEKIQVLQLKSLAVIFDRRRDG